MAKKTIKKELTGAQDLYNFLFEACNIIRGPVSQDNFKDYITPLLYYKRISDVYDEETQEELARDHQAMPHGGFVIRSGQTGEGTNQTMEFSLKLDSNPEFTSSVLVAYARAAARLAKEGVVGAQTPFDIAPKYIHPKTNEQLRKQYL